MLKEKTKWAPARLRTVASAFWKDETGATAVEYGLIAGLIAVAIVTALTAIGTNVAGVFNTLATAIKPTSS